MKRTLVWTTIFAVALLALACGDDDEGQHHGSLDVQVLAVNNGATGPLTTDVRAVVIELSGRTDYRVTLTRRSDIEYVGRFAQVLTGEYTATARAYDNVDGNGEPLFEEVKANPISIEKDQNAGLVFTMNVLLPDDEFTLPHFTNVSLDRTAVDQDEMIFIEVEAGGGVGTLTLSGRHAPGAETMGIFGNPHVFDPATETGKIRWKAPAVAGPIWFALVLTDTQGNQGELGITVFVGAGKGSVQATASFNLAPDLDLQVRTLDDAGTTTVTLAIDAADATAGPMTFLFEGDCGGRFVPALPNNTFTQASPVQKELTYVIDGRASSCWMSLEVSDAAGASSKKTIILGDAAFAPEGLVPTVFGGFDAIVPHEFAPVTIQPKLVSTYSSSAKILARVTLEKDGTPVVGDFALYEDDLVTSVTPASPNTLTLSSSGSAVFGPEAGFAAATLKAGPTWHLGLTGLAAGDYSLLVKYYDVTASELISAAKVEFSVR